MIAPSEIILEGLAASLMQTDSHTLVKINRTSGRLKTLHLGLAYHGHKFINITFYIFVWF